eukprot:3631572-Rhodomonas_salina.1
MPRPAPLALGTRAPLSLRAPYALPGTDRRAAPTTRTCRTLSSLRPSSLSSTLCTRFPCTFCGGGAGTAPTHPLRNVHY